MAKHDRVHGPYLRGAIWRIIVAGADGSRRYRSFASKAAAEDYRQAAEEELAAIAGITFTDAIERYERHMLDVLKGKPRSVASTMLALRRMFRDGAALVADLRTPDQGEKLYQDLQDYRIETKLPKDQWVGYAVDTHRNTLAEAKTFLRWCVKKKFVATNALETVKGIGKRIPGKDLVQLRFDEATRWMDVAVEAAADGDEGALAALVSLILTLRSVEVVRIVVRDLDRGGELLWVPDAKTPSGRRTIEIPPVLQPLLNSAATRRAPNDYIFGNGKKHRDRNWVRKSTKRLCRLAHVPEVTAHSLRRLHATLADEAGHTGHAVAKMLGHSSFNVTKESYIKRGTSDARQRRQLLEVLEGGRDRRGPQQSPDDTSDTVREALTKK